MSSEVQEEHISKIRVVYHIPGMEDVPVRLDIEYGSSHSRPLTLDLYYPPKMNKDTLLPFVIFVSGYSDIGMQKIIGCKAKEMGAYISWAQLIAASGMIAVTYSNDEPHADFQKLFLYLQQNASSLRIDISRFGLWASSGNVPMALSLLTKGNPVYPKCAALCYGFMLDIDPNNYVSQSSRAFGFVNPCQGKTAGDINPKIPLFIVKALQDHIPNLNQTIDQFVSSAEEYHLPLTLVTHSTAPHAFDLMHHSQESREIIKQILEFLKFHLVMK